MYLLAKILVISTTVVLSYGNSRVHVVDDFPIHFGDQCKDKFSRTIYNNLEGNHVNDDPLIYGLTEASFIGEVGMAVFSKLKRKKNNSQVAFICLVYNYFCYLFIYLLLLFIEFNIRKFLVWTWSNG